jgi:hypothetical protein
VYAVSFRGGPEEAAVFDDVSARLGALGVRRDPPRDEAPARHGVTSPKLLLRRALTEARDRLSAF